MRRSTWFAVGILVALAGCSGKGAPLAADDTAADVQAIRNLLADDQAHNNTGDTEAMLANFTDDVRWYMPGWPDIIDKPALSAYFKSSAAIDDVQIEINTEEIELGGDIAYERGTYIEHHRGKSDGRAIKDVNYRHLRILRRQLDGSWKTSRVFINSAQ